MRHAVTARAALCATCALLSVTVAVAGCRRDAKQRLGAEAMFPDAGSLVPVPTASAAGTLTRAELVVEHEPNDRPEEAQAVSGNALITGDLAAPAPADSAAKSKKSKGKEPSDSDWFRLPATPPGQLLTVDLREGPPGAVLELYDDTGRTQIARARTVGGVRPVLPALGQDSRASLVRVTVDTAAKGEGRSGPYKLATYSRPAKPDEEQEPNATVKATTLVVGGAAPGGAGPLRTMQGTLAPEGDVDMFLLDPTDADKSAVWVLDVTAVPGVAFELQLLDPASLSPILVRRGAKDQGITVPNLGVGRLPRRPVVVLKALAGQAPDQPYVLSLTPLLPAGCSHQADCLDRLPQELEPNETREQAQPLPAQGAVVGFLDAPGDVDTLELSAKPADVLRWVLTPPPDTLVRVVVGDGADAVTVSATEVNQPLVVAAVAVPTGRLTVVLSVLAQGKKPATPSARVPWKLESAVLSVTQFEVESGDESHQTGLWSPDHAMTPVAADAQFAQGSWQRTGALWPAGDVDGFGLDLRQRSGVVGVELLCAGDGLPGLTCTVLDNRGTEQVHLAAGTAERPGQAPMGLLPGQYRVVVAADKARASAQPYRVVLREAPEMAILPVSISPTAP